jgi:hypothetical protein
VRRGSRRAAWHPLGIGLYGGRCDGQRIPVNGLTNSASKLEAQIKQDAGWRGPAGRHPQRRGRCGLRARRFPRRHPDPGHLAPSGFARAILEIRPTRMPSARCCSGGGHRHGCSVRLRPGTSVTLRWTGSPRMPIAFKTGTSYGDRGCLGNRETAIAVPTVSLAWLGEPQVDRLRILFPSNGATLDSSARARSGPLALRATGGVEPFTVFVSDRGAGRNVAHASLVVGTGRSGLHSVDGNGCARRRRQL